MAVSLLVFVRLAVDVYWEGDNRHHDVAQLPIGIRPGNEHLMNRPLLNSTRFGNTEVQVISSRMKRFAAALGTRSDVQKRILLAQVDEGFLEMAFNLYELSLKPLRITNFLFIGSTPSTCSKLEVEQLPCYMYRQDSAGKVPSLYQSKDFLRKMNMRTDMVLDAIRLGYSVLHVDVDVVLFQNPFEVIPCSDDICDMMAMKDGNKDLNAGFIYLRPTPVTLEVYERMQILAREHPKLDDQDQISTAIRAMRGNNLTVKASHLDPGRFLSGQMYFERGNRTFARDSPPCVGCVMFHNNWIVSYRAKVYRFKELHFWLYDGPDGYYTNSSRKYLAYENPVTFPSTGESKIQEREALISALAIGSILGRTVVLPAFHCGADQSVLCGLNSYYKVRSFDNAFGHAYREHTFLSHPKVPANIKNGKYKPNIILSQRRVSGSLGGVGDDPLSTQFRPKNPEAGATSAEILAWFKDVEAPVLFFQSLYGAFGYFDDPRDQKKFDDLIKNGLIDSGYRQFG